MHQRNAAARRIGAGVKRFTIGLEKRQILANDGENSGLDHRLKRDIEAKNHD
jgi:hypothetical protein